MFPAGGFELGCSLGTVEEDLGSLGAGRVEGSDAGDGDSCDAGGDAGFGGG